MLTAALKILTSRLGGWIIGGLGILVIGFLLTLERAKVGKLEAEKDLLVANQITLEGAIETQAKTAGTLSLLTEATIEQNADFFEAIEEANAETARIRSMLDELRATEEANAILQPYERGLAARSRLTAIMRRFQGRPATDIDDTGGDDSDTEPAEHTP